MASSLVPCPACLGYSINRPEDKFEETLYISYAGGCKINVLRKVRELTLQKTTGRKSQTCNKKDVILGVAFKGKSFVADEKQDSKSRLKTCEMNNTSTNEWQFNLNVRRARMIYKDKYWIDIFTGCVLKLSKGVLENFMLLRNSNIT